MVTKNDAFLFLLEVDKEFADDLGEISLASEIISTATTSRNGAVDAKIDGGQPIHLDDFGAYLGDVARIARG